MIRGEKCDVIEVYVMSTAGGLYGDVGRVFGFFKKISDVHCD